VDPPPPPSPARKPAASQIIAPAAAPAAAAPPPSTAAAPKDEKLARIEAEDAFNKGKRFLAQQLLGAALKEFQRAATLHETEPEYQMQLAWVEYLTAKIDAHRNTAKVRAGDHAVKTLKQQRGNIAAHRILGHILKVDGDLEKAKRHFDAALEIDPRDYEALRELRVLNSQLGKVKGRKKTEKSE
jgi:tetratricopeptide (TPR) repeat protein